jgi:hypothetical protein
MGVELQPERHTVLKKLKELFFIRQQASLSSQDPVDSCSDQCVPEGKPFSTNPRFYVYGYENLEQPESNATVTFLFLPKLWGSSSAHLVVQTNFGGFITQAKGLSVHHIRYCH